MSKVKVGWAPLLTEPWSRGLALFVNKPENLFDQHMRAGSHRYRLCPATRNLAQNTFVVKSPFDAHFILDADLRNIEFIQPHVQNLEFFNLRGHQYAETDEPIMSINFFQLFVTEQPDVEAMVTAPWFEKTQASFRVIPGRYRISDWWRPLDFALQLPQRRSEVKIRSGDVLFYITFSNRDPESRFLLEEIAVTPELDDFINVTTGAKNYRPRCPLRTLYGFFDKYKHKPRLEFIDK